MGSEIPNRTARANHFLATGKWEEPETEESRSMAFQPIPGEALEPSSADIYWGLPQEMTSEIESSFMDATIDYEREQH